ncbi:MAG: radical SAM protein, partial [Deltaproteobacteria bacterium]|nr:radical SAM protein [Deltaproteobacteria bacterium]
MPAARRVALVCVGHWADEPRIDRYLPFSAGAYRVYAALRSPGLPGCEVRLFDADHADTGALVEDILAFAPDVLGGSAYVWSLPVLLEVAVQLKFANPYALVVLGGPSARPAMLDLPHYRPWRDAVDALVTGEGEAAMRALVADADRAAWAQVPGVAVRAGQRWRRPPTGASVALDSLPSPHQLDLAPRGRSASLETFRGCPLSCAFCEWGVWSEANRVFGQAWLERELQAYRDTGVVGAFLVDAGLNLNRKALRNLMAAEAQVGFFRDHPLATEIYAAHLRDEDFAFLARVRCGRLGVGLQSNEDAVLRAMQRPHHRRRFEHNLARLSDLADCVVELIVGLPGDSFAGVQRSLAYAAALPCAEVHVYHCLALPDGLMTRAPAGSDCAFDPVTLRMRSCAGWPAAELDRARAWLADQAAAHGGDVSEDYWSFPGSRPARTAPVRPDTGRTYARPLQAGEAG